MKRLLLFFDGVIIPDPEDRAVVNDNEVIENFGRATVHWSPRGPYPRVAGYEESVARLLEEVRPLRNREIVQVAPARAKGDLSIAYLKAQALGLAQTSLVRAAIPDYSPQVTISDRYPDSFVLIGGAISPSGHRSRYSFEEIGPPAELLELEPQWLALAQLRLGRTLKYLSLAANRGAIPVADDDSTTSIQAMIAGVGFGPQLLPDELASLVLATDQDVSSQAETALDGLDWRDILQLRNEIRPVIDPLRRELHKITQRLSHASSTSLDAYRSAFAQAKSDYDLQLQKEREALAELRIGGLLKAALPSLGAWLAMITPPLEWMTLAERVFAAGLVAGAALSSEVKNYYVARQRTRNHALFLMTASLDRFSRIMKSVKGIPEHPRIPLTGTE